MIPPLFDFGFVYEWVSLKEIASFSKFHFPLKLIIPGFHVAKSVKLENLDKTPTLGEITGVLNQYYMNLQPQ